MKQFVKENWLVLLFISLFFFVRLFELNTVGETWDEIAKIRNGQLHLKAISHLDFSYDTWVVHKEHPPVGKILLALPTYLTTKFGITLLNDSVYQVSKQYNLARLVSLIFACGTLLLTFLISKKWFNLTVAWLSVIGLSLFPHFVAHSFIATLESPQTFFITLLFFTLVYLGNSKKIKDWLIIAIVVALGLLVKLSSIFFLPLPFLFSLASGLKFDLSKKNFNLPTKKILKHLFIKNLIIYSLAMAIFILLWPWLWANPVTRFLETLNHFNVTRTEYFMGKLINPPFYYYLYYFAISVPVVYFIGFIFGIKNIFSRKYLLILIWFLLPFIASFSGFKQNGVRYLHSSFPAFCILVGVGYEQALHKLKVRNLVFLLFFVILIVINLLISPYYLDYYNILVKGPANVYSKKLAQIGWWGEGSKQAILFLNNYTNKKSSVCIKLTPAHVIPNINDNFTIYYDNSNSVKCKSQYLIINTLDQWLKNYTVDKNTYEIIFTVKAFGAPLAQVYKHK